MHLVQGWVQIWALLSRSSQPSRQKTDKKEQPRLRSYSSTNQGGIPAQACGQQEAREVLQEDQKLCAESWGGENGVRFPKQEALGSLFKK